MQPIGEILAYAYISGLFRIITKSAEEPNNGVHLMSTSPQPLNRV